MAIYATINESILDLLFIAGYSISQSLSTEEAPGAIADLVILSGEPFDFTSHLTVSDPEPGMPYGTMVLND